jgi:hypothetical protein
MRDIFESSEVVEVVGINPIYLNKFVERELYGIVPSGRAAVGRGGRRWFKTEDVYGIALVWWLFEAGLRSQVIRRVLRDFPDQKKANANRAAEALREEAVEFLVIQRTPRSGGGKRPKRALQTVGGLDESELFDLIEKKEDGAVCVIPVGRLFRGLEIEIGELD